MWMPCSQGCYTLGTPGPEQSCIYLVIATREAACCGDWQGCSIEGRKGGLPGFGLVWGALGEGPRKWGFGLRKWGNSTVGIIVILVRITDKEGSREEGSRAKAGVEVKQQRSPISAGRGGCLVIFCGLDCVQMFVSVLTCDYRRLLLLS